MSEPLININYLPETNDNDFEDSLILRFMFFSFAEKIYKKLNI